MSRFTPALVALAFACLASTPVGAAPAAAPVRGTEHASAQPPLGTPPAPGNDDAVAATADAQALRLEPPPGDRGPWLHQQLDALLGDSALAGMRVGVAVAEADTGKALYGRNENQPFNPASNVKLFTTAAALAMLGPEYRWKTVIFGDSSVQGGEVKGRLYLKGHGDPTLVAEDLWRIVADLWAAGVRKVSGDLAVDDSFFDAVRSGPGFDQKQEDAAFRAPNGAVSLNYNAVGVHILPGASDGAPAKIVIEPPSPYFEVVNEARTSISSRTNITVEAKDITNRTQLHVKGRIRLSDRGVEVLKRVGHPDLYTGYALRELLSRRGIKVSGQVVNAVVPPEARALAVHYSAPLGVAVRDVNKHSNNFMAEQVMKTLGAETGGRPGTWPKGVEAVSSYLDKLGISRNDYKMTNGSGLYDSNRFTPMEFVTLLRAAYRDFRYSADYLGSLSLAGADGTIGHRMAGSLAERWVRAKSGTLMGVSCLTGYAGAPGRAPLVFSILMNDVGDAATGKARRVQDQIAETLVAYLAK
jgi:D-alanyl-D-alanine carboxypeptidase/D-alanyl-D-alanine-endopeptidase (penicillin-binding protein 4)